MKANLFVGIFSLLLTIFNVSRTGDITSIGFIVPFLVALCNFAVVGYDLKQEHEYSMS